MMGTQNNSKALSMFVTHVDAEGVFLKIWGQTEKDDATWIERTILPFAEIFTKQEKYSGPRPNLVLDAMCCAKFHNGYYRAKIYNIRPDGMVAVHFVDYGNKDVLPASEVHMLDRIPNTEALREFPPLAYEYILANVLPVNNIWDNKTIEIIRDLLRYHEFELRFHLVVDNYRIINLFTKNGSVADMLVQNKLAIPAIFNQEMFQSIKQPTPQPQAMIHQHMKVPIIHIKQTVQSLLKNSSIIPRKPQGHTALDYSKNSVDPFSAKVLATSKQKANGFQSRSLKVGRTYHVYVSFVDDGPFAFSVQDQNDHAELSHLMREINEHPKLPLQEAPVPGSICLGRYSDDLVLCRAAVMGVVNNKCKVYYVDFGHTETLEYTDIFQLPPQFIEPRVLSIRVQLSGVKEMEVTDEMKAYFKQLVTGKSLNLHVKPPEGPPLIQYGDLYDNGKNIKDILKEAFPSSTMITYQEPAQLTKGVQEVVWVSFVESCQKFFVQLDKQVRFLETLMNNLGEYCKTAPVLDPSKAVVGLPCAALYESQWYRAAILKVNGKKATVLYVDYGNEEVVDITSLRTIHADLVKKLPSQAIECLLSGYETSSDKEVDKEFERLTLEKLLYMQVIEKFVSNKLLVNLNDPEKSEDIRIHLISFATKQKRLSGDLSVDQHNSSGFQRDDTNKQNRRNQSNFFDQRSNQNVNQERQRDKNWRDEVEVEKQDDNRFDKQHDRFHRDDSRNNGFRNKFEKTNDRFNRDESNKNKFDKDNSFESNDNNMRNDRFNRDGFRNRYGKEDSFDRSGNDRNNDRFNRDGPKNKFAKDDWKESREARGGKDKFSSNDSRQNRGAHWNEKSFSDKDSDVSSKSAGRYSNKGSVSNRLTNSRREGGNKGQSDRFDNKWNDRDDKNNVRSPRINGNASFGKQFEEKRNRSNEIEDRTRKESSWENTHETRPTSSSSAIKIQSPNIKLETVKNCEIVFVNNPTDFFIQLIPDCLELDSIMDTIMITYDEGGEFFPNSEILPGTYCIAQYTEDLRWYRAVIKSVETSNATVEFIDYGNTEVIEFSKIKKLKPEFSNLCKQAIHCTLLGTTKSDWTEEEIQAFDQFVGKSLEVEFVTEKNALYTVLLREVVDNVPSKVYVNQHFCKNKDLIQEKERVLSKPTVVSEKSSSVVGDYASPEDKWSMICMEPESQRDVIITWFTNPNNFYCQIQDSETAFKNMMNEIQKVYANKEPVSTNSTLKVGSPVIAYYANDGALYRAEIVQLHKQENCHIVQYIDFGNRGLVNQKKIYPVIRKFMQLPKQAFNCSLKNIRPVEGDKWPKKDTQKIDQCFEADELKCTYYETKDNKYIVSLENNGKDIAGTLVDKNLAIYENPPAASTVEAEQITNVTENYNIERIDISLLTGQTFRVRVSSVENVNKFYIQLPSAEKSAQIIDSYMTEQDSQMLKLPAPLAMMQNQSIECGLQIESSSSEFNEKLKELVEGKETILHVQEVNNNRLIVKLYDLKGMRIQISPADSMDHQEDNVSPICPLPILSSTHQVMVSYAYHSASIWLQRQIDYETDVALTQALLEHYSSSGTLMTPEPNALCVAKSADNHWYRAKIIQCTETGAYVNFIDIGNVEEVQLEAIKELDPKFFVPHQLAVEVSLSVTLKGSETEQVGLLQSHLSNKILKAIFYNVSKKWIVELFENDEKISDRFRSLDVVKDESSLAPGPLISLIADHEMKVGEKYEVQISHIDSPTQFWLQHVEEINVLAEKQAEFQNIVAELPSIEGIPEEGTLCAAIYSIDNMWYRAEVLDADEEIITVRFVDYGNTDVVDNKSGNIKEIGEGEWRSMKRFAIKSKLDVIPMGSEDWSEAACTRFSNLVGEVEILQALVIADSTPKRVKLLINDDKSISDILVQEQLAEFINDEEELIDEIVDLELDPHSAFVSHTNSPSEFWVQEEKSVANLEVISDRFMVADMFSKIDKIKEGLLCVAKFPEDDQWYRARVVSHSDAGTEVIYIDYGNSAVSTEIRAIPEDLADIPPLSRKCSLVLPEGVGEWSKEACDKFITLAADGETIFLLDILQEQETSLVKLTLNGENVADVLASLCEKETIVIEERLPPLGEENLPTGAVSHVNNLEEFWIQPESNMTELEMMSTRLENAASFLPLANLEVGTICAALYPDDQQWYRAKVLSCKNSDTEVLYIDYGNSAITDQLRILPEDIINIPVLSKRCALAKPNQVNVWSEAACEKFIEIVADGATMFQFEIVDNEDPLHINLSIDGNNIVDILVPLCKVDDKETNVIEKCDTNQIEEKAIEEKTIEEKAIEEQTVIIGFVSHVNSLEEFWIQKEIDGSKLDDMSARLSEQAINFSPLDSVHKDSICAAVFPDDEQWYRAKILSSNDNGTEVLYIDYGNSSITNELKTLPENIRNIPALAKRCALLKPIHVSVWSEQALAKFMEMVEHGTKRLEVEILDDEDPIHVNVKIDDINVADVLRNLEESSKESPTELTEELTKESPTELTKESPTELTKESPTELTTESSKNEEVESPTVFVSYITNLEEFWIQKSSDSIKLEEVSCHLKDASSFPKLGSFDKGSICAALYPNDEQWYRAKILSFSSDGSNSAEVLYIDYGNSSTSCDLRELPENIKNIPPLSTRCSLWKPNHISVWSEAAWAKFEELSTQGTTEFQLQIIPNNKEENTDSDLMQVNLAIDGQDIADILAPLCEASFQSTNVSKDIENETKEIQILSQTGYITHIENVEEFWFQKETDSVLMEDVVSNLTDAPSFSKLDPVEEGALCVALYPEDEQWYRATVLSNGSNNGAEVLYIDYGNSSVSYDLRILPDDTRHIPALAQRCLFPKPSHIPAWPEDAYNKFKELIDNGTLFEFRIIGNTDPVKCISLSVDGQNIIDILLPSEVVNKEIKVEPSDYVEEEPFNTHINEILSAPVDVKTDIITESQPEAEIKIENIDQPPSEESESSCMIREELTVNDIIRSFIVPDDNVEEKPEEVESHQLQGMTITQFSEVVTNYWGDSRNETDNSVSTELSKNTSEGMQNETSAESEILSQMRHNIPYISQEPTNNNTSLKEHKIKSENTEKQNGVSSESIDKSTESHDSNHQIETSTPQDSFKTEPELPPVIPGARKIRYEDRIVPGSIARGDSPSLDLVENEEESSSTRRQDNKTPIEDIPQH